MITSTERIGNLQDTAREMNVHFYGESKSAYLARAVSTVPESQKDKLEGIFKEIITAVEDAGLEAKLPIELQNIAPGEINPQNHEYLFNSKIVLPLTYAVSDGRSWEMGFSYMKKLIMPIVIPRQKINQPSLRLPFQIPIVYNGKESLTNLLRKFSTYSVGFGEFEGEQTVIGFEVHTPKFDLRKEASKYIEVIDWKI